MTDIVNPHDKFFKAFFTRPEIAKDFCHHYLPSKVRNELDLSTLAQSKDSFVDPELQEHYSDLLYTVQLNGGGEVFLYLLFEHKSYPDPLVALQIIRYKVRIWENDQKVKESNTLKPILPVVIYHGRKGWNISQQFEALFSVPAALDEYLPHFRYLLIDLSQLSDEEIAGILSLQVALLMMKYIQRDELGEKLEFIFRLINQLQQQKDVHDMLITVLRYIIKGTDQVNYKQVAEIERKVFVERGCMNMPTIAEELMEKGRQEGQQVGWQEGRQTGLTLGILRVLNYRFTPLSDKTISRINKIEKEEIVNRLYEFALSASTIEEFEQHLPK